MTDFPDYDANAPVLFSSWARDDQGNKLRSKTADAYEILAAAIRFDALREAGLIVEEHERGVGEADAEVVISWCYGKYDLHMDACPATTYDIRRWQYESGLIEWVDSVIRPDPRPAMPPGEAPF